MAASRHRLLLAAACVLLAGRAGARQRWPTPALGSSPSGAPEILFTFDDGPDEATTGAVLDALKASNVKAVFFMVGRRLSGKALTPARAELVRRVIAEGHAVGNHTVSHAHLCTVKAERAAWELDENARILNSFALMDTVIFRAPYGSKCTRLLSMLAERRLWHLFWDIDPQEWRTHDPHRTRNYVARHLSQLDGRAVILLHDIHPVTAKALPEILAWIGEENARRRERGAREIRVLEPADIAVENLAPGLTSALADAAAATADAMPDLVRELLAPLVPRQDSVTAAM